jgi:hypothetical protein
MRADTYSSNMPPPTFFPQVPEYNLRTALESIPKNELIDSLLQLNTINPSIATWARSYHHFLAQREQRKIVKFDRHSDELWKEITIRHDRLGGSKEYEKAEKVLRDLKDSLETISTEVHTTSSWETKKSAMETLRKITKVILDSQGVIADEIRKVFQYDCSINNAFLKVVRSMSAEERAKMCDVDDGTGPFSDRLVDIVRSCNNFEICKDLDDVVDLLLESIEDDAEYDDDE